MRRLKKYLAFVISLIILMTAIPTAPVFAGDYNGKCGENATWSLDVESGVLTISGSGDMYNYSYTESAPWESDSWLIKHVTVGNGITSIGDYAFSECYNLKSFTLPNSIISIGKSAFYNCSSLTSAKISEGVTSIGEDAFCFCRSIESVILPNSVISIGGGAFSYCESITSITIPENVSSIGKSTFYKCSALSGIYVEPNNRSYVSVDGVLFNRNFTELMCYPSDKRDTSYAIPDGVSIIVSSAFEDCSFLSEITIPGSVENLGKFYGCKALSKINVALDNKFYTSVDGVLFNKDITEMLLYPKSKVEETYTIPESITYIKPSQFSGCTNITTIIIPEGVNSVGEQAFWRCSSLKKVYLPKSINVVGKASFGECTSLSDIYYGGSKEEWEKLKKQLIFAYVENADRINIHYNSNAEQYIDATIQFGSDRFNFGKDMSGYVGEEIRPLLVYTSKEGNIASLDITSSNPDVVEISEIVELGRVEDPFYDDSIGQNEHAATVTLKLKAEGSSKITITSREGISESIIVTVSKVPEVKKSIAVFTTEKSLSIRTGERMWLAFGLMDDATGLVEENWRKMAVVVSDPSIISLSDYEETAYGYSLEVIGKKEGSTNLTITDTESGTSTVITVIVYDNYIRSYSYAINDIEEFYPGNKFEKDIKTNIYDLNGLYVNNYTCIPAFDGSEFQVSFDVYNSLYYNGAVDIYDADGVWIDCEYIDRYSDITSLRDTGEQLFFLIYDTANKQLLSYQSSSFSKKTSINIKVPQGGYFTISNNMAESPGTFFANAFEIIYDTTSDLIDFASSKSTDKTSFDKFYKEATKSFAQNVIDARNESLSGEAKKKAMEVALNSLTSEIKKVQKKFISTETKDFVMSGNEMFSGISSLAENILNSYSINWKHLYQGATGVGESMFIKFSGPAGPALKGMFAITKGSNKLLMAAQMSRSLDNTYATIYSSVDEGNITSQGVIINTNGNIDTEAVLQVFKVSDNDTMEVVLNSNNPLEKYELYNICFVKDDKLVQPNGKVKVHVPIPEGMNRNTCKIYRQEPDDSWTILDAHIEGNYLVFETDHFSLYSVIGDMEELSISSLPSKTSYKVGDVLDTSGLTLKLNNQVISQGFICEPTVLSGIGKQTIMVKYGCTSAEFVVNVNNSDSYDIHGVINSFGPTEDNVIVKLIQGTVEIASIETTRGIYSFESINNGTYTLEVSKDNHVTRKYQVTVSDADIVQDVKIHLLGDVTGDGKVNIIDVNRVYAHVRETNPLTGYELECANVAGSVETVNTIDVNRIYAHVKETNSLW